MKTETLQDYKRRMQRVLTHIQQHLDDPMPLDALAGIACFSPYHFHRVFTGMVGEPVKEYVRRLRLERAAGQLKHGADSVIAVALAAGYESHEAFTRAFRLTFGQSPAEFRLASRATWAVSPAGLHYEAGGAVTHFRTQRGGVMEVTIKTLAPMRVAFVHHAGPYEEVGEAWDRLCLALGKEGWLGGEQKFIGVGYDDPAVTPPERVRYDACITVGEEFVPPEGIEVKTIEGGEYAAALHQGPYHEVSGVYSMLYGQWLPRSGRRMRNQPALEFYLNDPDSTEPLELLTEIYAPLAPKGE
jgi:AraC family transcriptional regulator